MYISSDKTDFNNHFRCLNQVNSRLIDCNILNALFLLLFFLPFTHLLNSSFFASQHVPPSLFTEPNEISQYLPIKETICEKLEFPEMLQPKPEAPLEDTCVKSN